METLEMVREFHYKFDHPVAVAIAIPHADLRVLRCRLLLEEVGEYCVSSGVAAHLFVDPMKALLSGNQDDGVTLTAVAVKAPVDVVQCARELADIQYVCDGAMLVWGFPKGAIVSEVHRANMSKLGADGMPMRNDLGKILKGPNFTPPDVGQVLAAHGWTQNLA